MNRILPAIAAIASLLVLTGTAEAQWIRFRGPNGTGVSASANLPVGFGPEKAVIWKTVVPPGHSSPVLTSTRIFLTAHSAEKDGYKLFVMALDRKSGKVLWQREVPRLQKGRLQGPNSPASPSPVTDGSNVYAFFQEFGILAFDGDGREKWRLPLGPFTMFYGFGASPILVDNLLILPVDQDSGSYLIAVDTATGKTAWKVGRPGVISGYSTPTVYAPTDENARVLSRNSTNLGGDTQNCEKFSCGNWLVMKTSRWGSGYGSGLRTAPRTTLKMAVFAPMPRASVTTASSVNPGARRRPRIA